jgi:hypothetical protein
MSNTRKVTSPEQAYIDELPNELISAIAVNDNLDLSDMSRFARTNRHIKNVIYHSLTLFTSVESKSQRLTYDQIRLNAMRQKEIESTLAEYIQPPSRLSHFFTSLNLKNPPIGSILIGSGSTGCLAGLVVNGYGFDSHHEVAFKYGMFTGAATFAFNHIAATLYYSTPFEFSKMIKQMYEGILLSLMLSCTASMTAHTCGASDISSALIGAASAAIPWLPFWINNTFTQLLASHYGGNILGAVVGTFSGMIGGTVSGLVTGNILNGINLGSSYGASIGAAVGVGISETYFLISYCGQRFFKQRADQKAETATQLYAEKERRQLIRIKPT